MFLLALKIPAWPSSWRSLQLYKTLASSPIPADFVQGLQPAPSHTSVLCLFYSLFPPPTLSSGPFCPHHPPFHLSPFCIPDSSSRKPSLTTTTLTVKCPPMVQLAPCFSLFLFYSLYLSLISLSIPCFTPGLGDPKVGTLSCLPYIFSAKLLAGPIETLVRVSEWIDDVNDKGKKRGREGAKRSGRRKESKRE